MNVYNWSQYIASDTVPNFEKQTGIKVRYDSYDSDDTLQTKLLAGSSGYDIVVPTSNYLAQQIQAGVYQKLDK
ncbi:polyamine ABC transporter substrate-binding protein, partial [Paraburkholderia sp. SIMBA_049]